MLHACFDTSGDSASFALFRDNELLISDSKACRRGASALLPWISDLLQEKQLTTADIDHWSAGVGPGSFTGMRVSLAFVKACASVSGAKVRGLNSAYGYFPESLQDQTISVLHDGRRQEVIANTFELIDGTYQSTKQEVLTIAELKNEIGRLGTLISPMPQESFAEEKDITVLPCEEFSAHRFHNISWDKQFDDSLEPIYVRPAVFVEPKKHRDISDII